MFKKSDELKSILCGKYRNIYSFVLISLKEIYETEQYDVLTFLLRSFGYFGFREVNDFLLVPNASRGIFPIIEQLRMPSFLRVVTNIDNNKCPVIQQFQSAWSIYYNDPSEKIDSEWIGYSDKLRSIDKVYKYFGNVIKYQNLSIYLEDLKDALNASSEYLESRFGAISSNYKLYLKDRSGTLCRLN